MLFCDLLTVLLLLVRDGGVQDTNTEGETSPHQGTSSVLAEGFSFEHQLHSAG